MDPHDFSAFIYLVSILLSIAITLGVGYYTLRQPNVIGTRSFAVTIFMEAALIIAYLIGTISPTLQVKIFWDNIQWISILFLPLAVLSFAREYSDQHFKKPGRVWMGLSIIPILTVIFLFTNPLHGLATNSGQLISRYPFYEYVYNFGVLLWIGVIYALGLTALGIITLIKHAFRYHGIYQIQIWIIILGFVIPTLGSLIGVFGLLIVPNHDLDLSPYTFTLANLIIAFGLFHYRLFDIVPFARDQVMEKMADGVIILDGLGRILDINSSCKGLLEIPANISLGQTLTSILPGQWEQIELDPGALSGHKEITLDLAGGLKFIDVDITRLRNQRGDFSGHMMIFRDITARKLQDVELRRDQDTLERRVNERTAELYAANDRLKAEVEQRRRAELEKETQRSEMETLYKLMVELAALPAEADIEAFISNRLKELTNAYFVAVSEYDPLKKRIELRQLVSDSGVIREVSRLLGSNVTELTFPVSDNQYAEMVQGKVGYWHTLHETSFGAIPPTAGTLIEKLFNLDLFIGMAIQYQGDLMGSFILGLQRDQVAPSDWLVIALANVLSIIYRRKRAEKARIESETRFQNLADLLPQPIFECNLAGQITYANQIGLDMMGYSNGDQDISIANLFPPAMREKVLHNFQDILGGNTGSPHEYLVQRKDGNTFPVLIYSRPIYQEHKIAGLRGIVVDITERKQHEHELEVIVTMSRALRSAETSTKLLLMIYHQVIDLLHVDFATLELIDQASGDAESIYVYGLENSGEGMRTPSGQGLNQFIRVSKKPYLDNNLAENPLALDPLVKNGCTAIAGAPMIAEDELIGFLWIGRKTAISDAEVHLLAAIADIAASSIRRMTLHELTEKQVHHLSSLRKIDTSINSSKDLVFILGVLLEQTQTQLQADAADVLLCSQDLESLENMFGKGFNTPSFDHHTIRMNEGPAGMAVQNRQLVQIRNLMELGPDHRLVKASQKEGFVSYFAVPLLVHDEIKGVLEVFFRKEFSPDRDWLNFLETLSGQAAIAIEQVQLFNQLQQSNQELVQAYDATIEGWSKALDLRDEETEGHTQRVTEMTLRLARAMGFSGNDLTYIRWGALLHDIGKMGVPDSILLKPGPLTDEEWVIMRKHPTYAYEMLSPIAYLRPAIVIPYCHHEKWDGTGYPRGLLGEAIPQAARIFSVVDVWDALRSDRPYRTAWPEDNVRAYIRDLSGKQFDPRIVEAFLEMERSDSL